MGALTLKTFSFELRGWDLEKLYSIDLTDSFGANLIFFLNNKQIIQIELGYNFKKLFWIHDKARLFFDCFTNNNFKLTFLNLQNSIKKLNKIIYLFEICNFKYCLCNSLLIIYENLSVNCLCLLTIYSQKYYFIKLKKSENTHFNTNLESNFLFNQKINFNFYNLSFCLLVSCNTIFENPNLNFNLKQRLLKKKFKFFNLGSFFNFTYSFNYLGKTNLKILKLILEGVHFVCQDFKQSKNPTIFVNTQLLKKTLNFISLFHTLRILNNSIQLNILSPTVFETSNYYSIKPNKLNSIDFLQFSSLYLINLTLFSYKIINKIFKINILYFTKYNTIIVKRCNFANNFYDQQVNFKYLNSFLYIPTKTFLETKNYFFNNFGFIKNTNKLILFNKTKSHWKIIRNIFNFVKKNTNFINIKNSLKINFIFKNVLLKKYFNLSYNAISRFTKHLINTNTNHFSVKKKIFKIKKIKIFNAKINFWLNDFFTGGKDCFSINSLIMVKLSKVNRLQLTNFF